MAVKTKRERMFSLQCFSLQCFDTVGWATGRVRPVKSWVLICWWWRFHWSFARLIAPIVTVTSRVPLPSAAIKPTNLGSSGKRAIKTERVYNVMSRWCSYFSCDAISTITLHPDWDWLTTCPACMLCDLISAVRELCQLPRYWRDG